MNFTNKTGHSILLTIDVEDWFQVENFKGHIEYSSWPQRELRVEQNTHRLLDLFDSIKTTSPKPKIRSQKSENIIKDSASIDDNPQQTTNNEHTKDVRATFFVLGWIAERLPNLVREIQSRGHEVASHGYSHELCYNSDEEILKNDLVKSRELLEDITGVRIYGYRAPSFSINNDVLSVIKDSGYLYDSSYNNFGIHGRYGKLDLSNTKNKGIAIEIEDSFYELPISNLTIRNPLHSKRSDSSSNIVLPFSGGGYFRLIPFYIFKKFVYIILKKNRTYLFYLHPWEIDPDQPRVNDAPFSFKFRHYINLDKTYPRLKKLIKQFNNYAFITGSHYLHDIANTNN